MPLQKAVAVRHANVFTAPFLCFRSFPAAPSRLKTPACMKNHFPGLYSGKPTRCGPERRQFPINLDRKAIFNGKNNGTTYANLELRTEIQWKTLARQKTDIEQTFASYCLKVNNKWQRAIRTKEYPGQNETKWRTRQKNAGVKTMEISALNKESWCEGLELVRGTNGVSRETEETPAQNKTKPP